mgnify:CR=1 FL=1
MITNEAILDGIKESALMMLKASLDFSPVYEINHHIYISVNAINVIDNINRIKELNDYIKIKTFAHEHPLFEYEKYMEFPSEIFKNLSNESMLHIRKSTNDKIIWDSFFSDDTTVLEPIFPCSILNFYR